MSISIVDSGCFIMYILRITLLQTKKFVCRAYVPIVSMVNPPKSYKKSDIYGYTKSITMVHFLCGYSGYHGSLPDMKPIVSERQDQIRFSLCCTLEALMAQKGAKKMCEQSTSTLVTPDRSVLGQKSVDGYNSSRATKK